MGDKRGKEMKGQRRNLEMRITRWDQMARVIVVVGLIVYAPHGFLLLVKTQRRITCVGGDI